MIQEIYLLAAIMFVFGLKYMTRVKTAKRGNRLASLAMLLAVVATLSQGSFGWSLIIAGLIIGSLIGMILARKVQMTAMPQLVAIFNGLGGGASVLVALSFTLTAESIQGLELGTALFSLFIGSITFTGSFVAFAKLQGLVKQGPMLYKGSKVVLLLLALLSIGFAIFMGVYGPIGNDLFILVGLAGILGILLITPIGGADMPVVIAILNSYSGLAAAATGFVLNNILLIMSGALVGASGLILTSIMCKAMNRSLINVMIGGFGEEEQKKDSGEYTSVKETHAPEAAMLLEGASSVIIVPGYGMAVAQAQHAVKELTEVLSKKDVNVKFAIHPVAGRMPGHMNVLLAEADIPYELLKDLDSINNQFKNTDVVIILGANDVVNPAAVADKGSPLYGMPILNAHEAKSVLIVKRSLSPGFAGVKNDLFESDNSLMLFGDANDIVAKLVQEIQEL